MAALLCAAIGCSKKTPTEPIPIYSLSGRVSLVGETYDEIGNPLGPRIVGDADGVMVTLTKDGVLSDSTRTIDGGFAFRVTLGTYVASARVGAALSASTAPLHVHDANRSFPDVIELRSTAGLETAPNPFGHSIQMLYDIPTAGETHLEVLSVSSAHVRTLIASPQVPGVHAVTWDGADDAGRPVPPGPCWIVLDHPDVHEAALLFRKGLSVSGPVRLTSRRFDVGGADLGLESITDADGMRVRLVAAGPDALDSALTSAGRYTFEVAGAGTYYATASVVPSHLSSTPAIVVTTDDVSVTDTLVVAPSGDLQTYPNPFSANPGLAIEFTTAAAGPTQLQALRLDGTPAWSYAYTSAAGFNHVHWVGIDNDGNEVPNGLYWVVVRDADQERFNLVKKE